ncbi:hypothetical protein [Roseomonas sp. BN140053]|uniref:hypothetical protein n=1 Tax=Roseomonas sp. BN140053 TaxID=3391898 RepID=UPI0039EBF8B5
MPHDAPAALALAGPVALPSPRRLAHRGVAALTALSMLAGCAGVSTRAGRIGADDGTDACRQQVVALDSTGNFFAEDILTGAAIGGGVGALAGLAASGGNLRSALIGGVAGAAVGAAGGYLAALQRRNNDQAAVSAALATDLERENGQLDRTQIAFNQLMDCRFNRAQEIRQAARDGRMDRNTAQAQMAQLRDLTNRDIQLAQQINGQIGTRGAEFDTAIDTVAPGAKATAQASRAVPIRTAQVSRPVPLRLRPEPGAPEIGATVAARSTVQVRPAANGYALVETPSGQRGYVPAESVSGGAAVASGPRGRGRGRAAPAGDSLAQGAVPTAVPGDVRSLAASNIARRDNFNDSVAQAQTAAASGFELAAG